jgi:hypothetical protein
MLAKGWVLHSQITFAAGRKAEPKLTPFSISGDFDHFCWYIFLLEPWPLS